MQRHNISRTNRAGLRQNIQDYLSEIEFRQIVFDLNLQYDDLGGKTKPEKVMSLIDNMENNGRMYQLVNELQRIRPNVLWTYEDGETRPDNHNDGEILPK